MKLIPIAGKANANLYRHPETEIIYFWFAKKGKGRIQKSTRTTNLADARRIADELKFKFLGTRNPRMGRKLVRELFPEWLETKQIKSKATYERLRLSWDHLRPFIEGLGVDEINEAWWTTEYIPEKRKEKRDRKFFNERKTLSSFLIQMKDDGLLEKLPKLSNPDPEVDVGKVFTAKEIDRLLEHSTTDLKLQILMAVTMGMRKSEILLLAIDRIDREQRLIALKAEDTKIRKGRTFAISDAVWPLLKSRLDHPSGFVFPSNTGEARPIDRGGNQTAWDGARSRAKVSGRFHDLRHTFLTRAFKSSTNPALICDYAGVSLDEAQKTYLHFTPEDTRVVGSLVTFSMGEK